MTHTSTEQPEALRLADNLEANRCHQAARELRRLHARVQELEAQTAHMADLVELADYATKKLEASQAQRVPLTEAFIVFAANTADFDVTSPEAAFRAGIREAERAHGITQEKQG